VAVQQEWNFNYTEILVGELDVAGHAHAVVTDLAMDVIVIDACSEGIRSSTTLFHHHDHLDLYTDDARSIQCICSHD
jgi:hypothetical protein